MSCGIEVTLLCSSSKINGGLALWVGLHSEHIMQYLWVGLVNSYLGAGQNTLFKLHSLKFEWSCE